MNHTMTYSHCETARGGQSSINISKSKNYKGVPKPTNYTRQNRLTFLKKQKKRKRFSKVKYNAFFTIDALGKRHTMLKNKKK